ncbi:helix-turn-helix domain-containing protein [Sporosarcina sp. A2]|uniref:helix-turn-helix domain-containing protein n=1 Tax=Sporosarcina sp. A2 TaxID=3393449 RepID=UPI003D7B1F4F
MSSIILKIAEKMDGQRSLNASLHVLRGKRSGQTLQDVDYFTVKPYFALIPKLSESTFLEAAGSLQVQELLSERDGLVSVTEKGRLEVARLPTFHFDGWHYRGREELFFSRLLLLVQTLSQLRASEHSFLPISNDRKIQQFIKSVLRVQTGTRADNSRTLGAELMLAIKSADLSTTQAVIFSHRLTGIESSGWTWDQLEDELGEEKSSLQLEFKESLHRLIAYCESTNGEATVQVLHKLTEGIRIETPLTDSTVITKKLFDQGLSIEEIAIVRQLKANTIEDHITEMATNDPNFPIVRFVSDEDRKPVKQEVMENDVKRLRLLKERFPHLSYFQLRLILSTTKGEQR